jgi:hypothetical protein
MDSVETRFSDLLGLVLDGVCSDDEWEEFSRLEQDHPHLSARLMEEVFTHNLLQWQSQDLSEFALLELAASGEQEAPELASPLVRSRILPWTWAAAVVLLITTGMVSWYYFATGAAAESAIAEIVEHTDVGWSEDSSALVDGKLDAPGRLETSAGTYTLRFRSGPTVQIVGPASLNVESDMLVRLDRGQATARVPDSVKGFTIETPVAKVIDQGTEFGVAARDDGRTDVIVFEGKVDVEDTARAQVQPRRLIRGEAARIDDRGSMDRIMQVARDSAGGWWTTDRPGQSQRVIKLVRDNIPPNDGSKYFCYQITSRGLADDVFAYVDHPHQWNGLSAEGLPEFLRDADFVKTFNDYRYLPDFEMVVELSGPANLYIFFDDRVPNVESLPKWLTDQFEDTGVDIGLDEGPWQNIPEEYLDTVPDMKNGIGGGNSIERVFSVWRRRCLDTSPVMLGAMGKWQATGRAMYGIAATPLDQAEAPPAPQPEASASAAWLAPIRR